MRLRMAAFGTRISIAITRPLPFAFCSSDWQRIPSRTRESWARICGCWWAGKTSTMRLMVCAAEFVCSVPKVRWPVSAMRSADSTVSRSRISPMRTTSGSWRSALRRAFENECVSACSSRWLTTQFLCWWRNSTGSSMVMMCSWRSRLILPIIAARVVDLRDLAVNRRDSAALVEDVRPEARQPLDAEGDVELEVLLEAVLLGVGEDGVGQLLRLRRSQRRHVERRQLAVDADLRGRVGRDVEIRAPALDHGLEKLVQCDAHRISGCQV